ncbi:uncharacterized protein BX663DRAFT_481897 [Cokeromyces recurvatus]|uniref:uncharacterized protein n=1 Tax=Cokeromyces recurvatus TaxID=90255 RepID=UPI0022200C89|nr:uncharacterized protein BX663DRAFT_481897 [Cokeromyces recurvatus]KAI7907580.1 hypothetical protein BX663DRAFT_481897 [Cokeromyces recurvatus]
MGQQTSREHAPLTFGYVNQKLTISNEEEDAIITEKFEQEKDFVLANPHLYQLQSTCEQCQKLSSSPSNNEQVVVSLINEACAKCKKQKRLSLVRKDLAEDLEYIDQTYYPDLIHYNSEEDPMEQELLEFETDTSQQQQWSRLTIGEATTITPKGKPRKLTGLSMAVDLSNRSLVKLSPSIGYLDNLTKLNLSNNQMTSLPREIGYLKSLRVLNISSNFIEEIPDTIAFLTKLRAFNVAHNKLVQLPSSIGYLPKLAIIVANDNHLTSLPREFVHLVNLISLNVSNNPLKTLPAEIATLSTVKRLLTDNCPFEEEYTYDLRHDPPSLFEICARIAVRSEINIPNHFADHIKEYLSRADTCSYCKGPFFDSCVTRVRYIERRARQPIALQYTLCSAHWSDENDRLLAMFSNQLKTKNNSTHRNIDTEGLNDNITPRNRLRHRAYSDSTYNSHNLGNLLTTPIISSPLSGRSNANSLDNLSSSSSIPISLLKSQPNLPALPQQQQQQQQQESAIPGLSPPSSSFLSPNIKGNRPRASSAASVTKRLTNFIRSNSSTSLTRTRSSSNSSSTSTSSSSRLKYQEQPINTISSSSITITPRQLEVKEGATPTQGLRNWADSIQTASMAAAKTIATQQQQNQIESYFISKNNNYPVIMHQTELLSSET